MGPDEFLSLSTDTQKNCLSGGERAPMPTTHTPSIEALKRALGIAAQTEKLEPSYGHLLRAAELFASRSGSFLPVGATMITSGRPAMTVW